LALRAFELKVMAGMVPPERADDRELVRDLRQAGPCFAEMDAWNRGVNRAGAGADSLGGVGLRIEGLELDRPAC
jgi:hypothetical protein